MNSQQLSRPKDRVQNIQGSGAFGKKIWKDFEKIFAMPTWPPWFMGLDVLIMVKAGV
jgi:hypothetical protein